MSTQFLQKIDELLVRIKADDLMKRERSIVSALGGKIVVADPNLGSTKMINLCANNYLGLTNDGRLKKAATSAMHAHGFGMASVRFICGAKDFHRELEQQLAAFLGKGDAILFAACFDANGELFEPLLGAKDAIISDSLNHASIIDGVRLCKANRYRYANSDMDDLEAKQKQTARGLS